MKRMVVVVLAIAASAASTAAAQESRSETIAAEQARKAAALRPPAPEKGERVVRTLETMFGQPNGWFPTLETVYPGGGITLGAGYRRGYGDRSSWNIRGMYSLKNYKLIELATTSPGHASGKIAFNGRAGWRDATQVGFFGIGMTDADVNRVNFGFTQAYASGSIEARPHSVIVLEAGAGYDAYDLRTGKGRFSSIEQVYTPAEVPGLSTDINYVHLDATAAIDWRTAPAYSRRGGRYAIGFHDYLDRDDTFNFKHADAEVVQHIPILRENWVISLRGRVETEIGDSSTTPFFLLPSLGGGRTLRGYESWRFRDKHAVVTSAEWRWIPSRLALDMALFYDAGMVAPERRGLRLREVKTNVGVGIRFHTLTATALRVELARGDEGLQIVFAGGAAF